MKEPGPAAAGLRDADFEMARGDFEIADCINKEMDRRAKRRLTTEQKARKFLEEGGFGAFGNAAALEWLEGPGGGVPGLAGGEILDEFTNAVPARGRSGGFSDADEFGMAVNPAGGAQAAPSMRNGASMSPQSDAAQRGARLHQAGVDGWPDYNITEYGIWKDGKFEKLGVMEHDYTVGPTVVCANAEALSREAMADVLSRFAYPTQDPSDPVTHKEYNNVGDPWSRIPIGGRIQTFISADGLIIRNVAQDIHFFKGRVIRRARKQGNVWVVVTHGYGRTDIRDIAKNVQHPRNFLHGVNRLMGKPAFRKVDRQMSGWIARHYPNCRRRRR